VDGDREEGGQKGRKEVDKEGGKEDRWKEWNNHVERTRGID
jgi:hypothetical protein